MVDLHANHMSASTPRQIALPPNHIRQTSQSHFGTGSYPPSSLRNGHLNLDTFSPVNQNGSFEFDRVLKSGKVARRIRGKGAWKTSWKPVHMTLRPNLLSIYKDEDGTELRASITLSDVTAVALVKKSKHQHVFGVFTPSKNYHFQATSDREAHDWIERIRSEARVEEAEEEFFLQSSPVAQKAGNIPADYSSDDRSSSPELSNLRAISNLGVVGRPRGHSSVEYSGNDMTSYSDFSDTAIPQSSSPPKSSLQPPSHKTSSSMSRPRATFSTTRNISQNSIGFSTDPTTSLDPSRVVWHGYLLCLKTHGGVKQWKRLWVVLRPKNLSFYKNDSEYEPLKIIPIASIIDAAEIDPISRSKDFCLQVIVEDKTYRFCAPDEDALAKWLGALKSVLARRQEAKRKGLDVGVLPIR